MDRFETRVTDGELAIETADGWLHIGDFDAVVEELGEVYEIEYDEVERAMPWLETDDGILRIDVRETLRELSFDAEFVELLAGARADTRATLFVDLLRRIWDDKGHLEPE